MEKETEKERGKFPLCFSSATPYLFPRSSIYFPHFYLSRLIKESETWTSQGVPGLEIWPRFRFAFFIYVQYYAHTNRFCVVQENIKSKVFKVQTELARSVH